MSQEGASASKHTFTFDNVFPPETETQEVYDSVCKVECYCLCCGSEHTMGAHHCSTGHWRSLWLSLLCGATIVVFSRMDKQAQERHTPCMAATPRPELFRAVFRYEVVRVCACTRVSIHC